MPAVDPIFIELRLRADRLERELREVERRVGGSASRMKGLLSGLLAGASVLALAKQFLDVADASKKMEAQLRLASDQLGTFGQASEDVRRIAAETRSGLLETTSLYGKFIISARALGKSQGDAARASETFAKSLKVGGASAQEAASATLQFGQALGAGRLGGEEFNAVNEASSRTMRLLADALGVPQGALKKLAEEGKITSEVLFRALTDTKFTAGIDKEFATLPVTFSEAMQQVENAAIVTFGAFDRGGGFSTALANFITDGADGFAELEAAAEKMGSDVRGTIEGLADAFSPFLDTGLAVFDALGIRVDQFSKDGRTAIAELLGAFDDLSNYGNQFRALIGGNTIGRGSANSYKINGVETITPAFRPRFEQTAAASDRRRALDRVIRNGDTRLREDILRPAPKADPKPVDTAAAKKAEAARKKAEREAAAAARKAEQARLRDLREDEAFASEKASLNDDLLRARQSIATAAATLAQYELQEIEAARVRQNASYQNDVAQKKLTAARAAELTALNDRVAAARAEVVNARETERKRAEAVQIADGDLQNARDLAVAEGQIAETTDARRAATMRLLDLEYQMERARLDAILASQQSTDAEKEIARRRLAILPQLEAADRAAATQATEGPLSSYRREVANVGADLNTAFGAIEVDALQGLNDGLAEAIANGKSLGDVFKNVANSIIADLARIAVQQLIIAPLLNALGGGILGGGGGSFLSGIFGRASGGYVGPGQTVRVNEQRGGMELLRMGSRGGTVIPLGQASASARQAPTIVQQTFVLDARYGITTPELIDYVNEQARGAAAQGAAGGRALAAQDRANAARPRF